MLRVIPNEALADSFQQLYKRCQKCALANGDYFKREFCLYISFLYFVRLFTELFFYTHLVFLYKLNSFLIYVLNDVNIEQIVCAFNTLIIVS